MILAKTQEMAIIANQRLNDKTIAAIKDVSSSRIILIVTLLLCFFIALAIAASLTREVTEPVSELLKATRKIKTGELRVHNLLRRGRMSLKNCWSHSTI